MIIKFLKDSVGIIVGKPAEEIIDLIYSNKHVNEFLLSKKLKLTINQTRNILYKLSDYGVVSSVRKKDKRKGWYTYFWRIEPTKALEFLRNSLLKKAEQITYQIRSKETKDFYICERCNTELNEETALINSFTCNECGGLFSLKDNSKTIKELHKSLERLKEEISMIETELEKEKQKTEKSKAREEKKQKLIKEASRKKIKNLKKSKKAKEEKKVKIKKPKQKKLKKIGVKKIKKSRIKKSKVKKLKVKKSSSKRKSKK